MVGQEEIFKVTCDSCIYGRNIGGNDYACLSEHRRADRKKLVHNIKRETIDCEYGEYWRNGVNM